MSVDLLSVLTGMGFGLITGLAFWVGFALGRLRPVDAFTVSIGHGFIAVDGHREGTTALPEQVARRGKAALPLSDDLLQRLTDGTCHPDELRDLAKRGTIRIEPAK